jgi:polysaccharide export outer membrane protein
MRIERKVKALLILTLAILLLPSCSSKRNIVYLQDLKTGVPYDIAEKHEAVIQPNDRLNIYVSCKNQELALPFNRKGAYQMGTNGEVNNGTTTNNNGGEEKLGYLVDKDGNIQFPELGRLHVEGLTVKELSEMIKGKIIKGNYIPNPIVTIDFLNFKVYMLGAINNGPITVDDGQINLLQAISHAGDLGVNARADNVKVIREVNGKRMVYQFDIRKKDIYNSPAFYLQQNDIVYVEPKYRKRDAYDNGFRYFSVLSALASLAMTIAYIFK